MEKRTQYYLVTALCFFYILTGSTQAREFLSIDCGAGEGYTDERNIKWDTDNDFIQTGKSLQLVDAKFPLASLRYFPEGRSKNCFVLKVKEETTYLLRASFDPGNTTSGSPLDTQIDFNITVDSNFWFSYSASDNSRPSVWTESIFHTFQKNETYFCLLKGENGYPFINALELRELNITAYAEVKGEKFFVYFNRYNTGTKPDDQSIVRFPDDPYDRIWLPAPYPEFPPFSRAENLSVLTEWLHPFWTVYNWPPIRILQDAWVGRNLSSPSFAKPDGVNEMYFALYFEEIRPVNLTVQGTLVDPVGMVLDVKPSIITQFELNLTTLEDWHTFGNIVRSVKNVADVTITVTSQPWSKHDAILNGFEILIAQDIDTSATFSKDRTTLKALKESFDLQDWTGDPCYPVEWDWVKCDPKTSRIIKLLLSRMNISGSIPEEIGNLTELREIYLDNNNLTGSIPQSMTFFFNLTVLILDNNSLSGEIPSTFRNKAGLIFTFGGNPGLCLPGNISCERSPPSSAPAPSPATSGAVKDTPASDEISKKILIVLIVAALGFGHIARN